MRLANIGKILRPQEGTTLMDRYAIYQKGAPAAIHVPGPGEYDNLSERFAELSQDMGLDKTPKLLVVENEKPNAGSIKNGTVIITTGALEATREYEQIGVPAEDMQRAVLAHELEHHKHLGRDIAKSALLFGGVVAGYSASNKLVESIHTNHGPKPAMAFAVVRSMALATVAIYANKYMSHAKEYESDRAAVDYAGLQASESMLGAIHHKVVGLASEKIKQAAEKRFPDHPVEAKAAENSLKEKMLQGLYVREGRSHPSHASRVEAALLTIYR